MARGLSTAQRTAIRWIAEGKWEQVQATTMNALVRFGYVTDDRMALSPSGQTQHRRIMESGDGPEDFKALLSFGRGGRR